MDRVSHLLDILQLTDSLAAEREDMNTVFRLDRLIHSMKPAKETREGKSFGHQPVVFALVCRNFGVSRDDTVSAFLYSTVSSIVSAGVRLIPLGHTDGQRAIAKVKSLVASITDEVSRLNEDDISAFAPGIEIMSMKHEHLYTRLFKS